MIKKIYMEKQKNIHLIIYYFILMTFENKEAIRK